MRLYHSILLLSALIIAINGAFQAIWLGQFSHMRDSVQAFGSNWLPTVSLAGELNRLTAEFRRLELRYILAGGEDEIEKVTRRMSRQAARIHSTEQELGKYLNTREEQAAFSAYLEAKREYVRENRRILEQMFAGEAVKARDLALMSAQSFASMGDALLTIERISIESGENAERDADRRFKRVARSMVLVGFLGAAAGVAAAALAARRISRPIAELARYMDSREDVLGEDIPPPPARGPLEVSMLYGSFRSLTEKLAQTMDRLEKLAVTDQLTGVANRRRLMEEGAKVLDICRRGGRSCAALMLDLDHFKSVNDTRGHATGDAVLRHVAGVLASISRGSDLLARYGGEEFVLLAPNSGREETQLLAERVRAGVEKSVPDVPGEPLRITVSIGLAVDGPHVKDLSGLLDRADQALYRAKENGRNRVEAA